jgi:hypothetical protein
LEGLKTIKYDFEQLKTIKNEDINENHMNNINEITNQYHWSYFAPPSNPDTFKFRMSQFLIILLAIIVIGLVFIFVMAVNANYRIKIDKYNTCVGDNKNFFGFFKKNCHLPTILEVILKYFVFKLILIFTLNFLQCVVESLGLSLNSFIRGLFYNFSYTLIITIILPLIMFFKWDIFTLVKERAVAYFLWIISN